MEKGWAENETLYSSQLEYYSAWDVAKRMWLLLQFSGYIPWLQTT